MIGNEPKTIATDSVWRTVAKYLTVEEMQEWLIDLEDRISKLEIAKREEAK